LQEKYEILRRGETLTLPLINAVLKPSSYKNINKFFNKYYNR